MSDNEKNQCLHSTLDHPGFRRDVKTDLFSVLAFSADLTVLTYGLIGLHRKGNRRGFWLDDEDYPHKRGKMKKIILLVATFVFVAGAVDAAAMRTHKDRKAKFSIQHPANWKKKTNQDGINLMLLSKDSLANVQVIRSDVEAGTPTDTFLAEVEKSAGAQHVNQLPADKRAAQPDDLAKMNAEQGTAGYYVVENDGVKIHQLIMAVRKGAVMYAIIVTFADQGADQYREVSTQIADSFTVLD